MIETIHIRFLIRTSKSRKNGEAPIYMRITVDGRRSELSTGRTILPDRWDSNAQKVKGRKSDAQSINSDLDLLKNEAHLAKRALIEEGESISCVSIKKRMRGVDQVRKPILEIFSEHNKHMKANAGKGKEYAFATYKKYRTALKHIKVFLIKEFGDEEYLISRVDHSFLERFEYFLKGEKKCSHNSAMKYLSNFKKITNLAIKQGCLNHNPFDDYDHKYKKKKPVFLSQDELDRIEEKELHNKRLDKVRDIFVFSCYTGLGFSDAEKLQKSDIKTDNEGEAYLYLPRTKTGEIARVMLLPPALQIIERYSDDPETSDGTLLPMISNQKTNAYLKEIAVLCDIKKKLTHHVVRHTCATTVLLANDVPITTVQKILAHAQLSTTMHYAQVTQKKVNTDLKILRKSLD